MDKVHIYLSALVIYYAMQMSVAPKAIIKQSSEQLHYITNHPTHTSDTYLPHYSTDLLRRKRFILIDVGNFNMGVLYH